jgi:hypothetical protein
MTEQRFVDAVTGELINGQVPLYATNGNQYVANSTYTTGGNAYSTGNVYQTVYTTTNAGYATTGASYITGANIPQGPQVVNTVVNTGKEVIKGESRIEYVPFEKKII